MRQNKPHIHKVLMLIENTSFPWDRRVFHEATALQEAGYQVSVICPAGEGFDASLFDEVRGIKVYRYPTLCAATSKWGYLVEYAWALLCTAILSLVAICRGGVDVVHSANPPDIFFPLGWVFKVFGKKYVFDEHDLCPELYASKFGRKGAAYRLLLWLEKQSYKTANLVVCPNQSYRDVAQDRGTVTDGRLAIVRNGVDIATFNRRPSRADLKGDFKHMAVYLGVMGRQDGVDRIVRAAHHLVHNLNRRDVLFVMIGKGECWEALRQLSRDLKVDDVVHFAGRISDELLLDYLSTADVCLAPDPPDRMNQLSTMTKIMEYMACGNPIVSFDLLETRRSAGDAAIYVAVDDAGLFASALSNLLDNPTKRAQMREIAIDRSINLVGLDRSRKSLLEAYARLLGRTTGTPLPNDVAADRHDKTAYALTGN